MIFQGQLLTYKLALIPCLGLCPALVASLEVVEKKQKLKVPGLQEDVAPWQ